MNAKINTSMTAGEWGLLIALSAIWGGSFFFIGVAVQELPPLTVVAVRVTGGAALLWLTVALSRQRLTYGLNIWAAFAVMGILNNVIPFSLIAWGQTFIGSGLASILNAVTPLFTVLVAHLATADERITPLKLTGVIVGFAGVAVMIGLDAVKEGFANVPAQLAIVAASLGYALTAVYARRFRHLGIPPMAAAMGQMTTAAMVMIPMALLIDRPWMLPVPSSSALGALLGLVCLATFVAYIIYYRLVATAGSVNLMLVTFLVPVVAILLGAAFLGERLGLNHFAGMAAIGIGLAAIDGRPMRYLRSRFA